MLHYKTCIIHARLLCWSGAKRRHGSAMARRVYLSTAPLQHAHVLLCPSLSFWDQAPVRILQKERFCTAPHNMEEERHPGEGLYGRCRVHSLRPPTHCGAGARPVRGSAQQPEGTLSQRGEGSPCSRSEAAYRKKTDHCPKTPHINISESMVLQLRQY